MNKTGKIVVLLSGIAVLWVHDLLTINFWVIIDLIILYVIILILETILKKFIPAASTEAHHELHLGKV